MQGLVSTGFETAARVFRDVVDSSPDDGAGFCVYVDGQKVIDVVGGWADRGAGIPYTSQTLQLTFSCTEGRQCPCACSSSSNVGSSIPTPSSARTGRR